MDFTSLRSFGFLKNPKSWLLGGLGLLGVAVIITPSLRKDTILEATNMGGTDTDEASLKTKEYAQAIFAAPITEESMTQQTVLRTKMKKWFEENEGGMTRKIYDKLKKESYSAEESSHPEAMYFTAPLDIKFDTRKEANAWVKEYQPAFKYPLKVRKMSGEHYVMYGFPWKLVMGAEEKSWDDYPDEFVDEVYPYDSHPNADTYDMVDVEEQYLIWENKYERPDIREMMSNPSATYTLWQRFSSQTGLTDVNTVWRIVYNPWKWEGDLLAWANDEEIHRKNAETFGADEQRCPALTWRGKPCGKRLYSNRFISPRPSNDPKLQGMLICGDCVSSESYAQGLGEWVDKYGNGSRLDAETISANVAGIEIIVDDANMKHLPSIKATIADNMQNPIGQWKCWGCGETYETSKKPKMLVKTTDKQGAFCGCGKMAENWGGDPDGPLAKALAKARAKSKEPRKPLKIEKLPHRDQTSLKDFEAEYRAEADSRVLVVTDESGLSSGEGNIRIWHHQGLPRDLPDEEYDNLVERFSAYGNLEGKLVPLKYYEPQADLRIPYREVFGKTQNDFYDNGWLNSEIVEQVWTDEEQARSTSVGDVIHILSSDEWFLVAPVGFIALDPQGDFKAESGYSSEKTIKDAHLHSNMAADTRQFMKPADVIDAFKKADGSLVSITFVKRTTGDVRKMLARTGVRKGVKGVGLKFNPRNKSLIGVYDFDKVREGADPHKCYRFVPIDAVISMKVRGKTYTA